MGILFPVIFTYVRPQLQDTVATSVVYTKRHHVPEKFSQRWLPAQWGLLGHPTQSRLFLGCPLGWGTS